MGDGDVRVAVALIVFLDVAAGFENLFVAERAAGLHLGLLGQLLVGENGISDEAHASQPGPRGHFRDELHAATDGLGEETHVIDEAGFVERLDVIIQTLGAVSGAGLRGHQVPQPVLVHGLRAAVADGDFRDVFPLEVLRVKRAREREDGERGKSGELTHAARHEE